MNLSLNEVAAMAKKATRGTGFSWGHSEDAGRAIKWLCEHGSDGCGILTNYLTDLDSGAILTGAPSPAWVASNGMLCPILTGSALSDQAGALLGQTVTLKQVAAPCLIAPAVAHVASVTITQNDDVIVTFTGPPNAPQTLATRANTTPAAWDTLQLFAARTYAPATEESRLRGAGSGTSDSD